ncbi:MAG TPA: cell surface protein SprA [Candidatus Krumholzibacteria bacterium]|nr:cell surface protein SprA [Candidatus Krumholzibacteria bacterium]HRX50362.1 cell surface protein SprA [Candidatus Krumholzibacteria bacterium]
MSKRRRSVQRSVPPRPRRHGATWRLLAALLLLAAALPAGAKDLILPGLDPLLQATNDPRLLGEDRLVLLEGFKAQGVEPGRGEGLPSLDRRFHALFDARVNVDLERMTTDREVNGVYGLETVFRYPDWFFLYQTARRLPGGFTYYPPRAVEDPLVEVFVDDVALAQARRLRVSNRRHLLRGLNVAGGGVYRDEGLINLTIPVKFPRTLERIIGRGEKTNIRITGTEHISLGGESTISNKFVPNERRQSQSLFPSLDMEQQLQINLSGQIGEKVHIEVDHNSEAIGPEATKIRLYYEGSEDEIIQKIETGDVGLTLPGSQLLGYASNKSGLFGLKVTGQMGAADFTVVASKQKAETSSQKFNSSGGTVGVHEIAANRYLNNRFFRLDLPLAFRQAGYYEINDVPGRNLIPGGDVPGNERIDPGTIQVFRFMGDIRPGATDVQNVVAIPDTTGRWEQSGPGDVSVDQDGDGDVDFIDWSLLHRPAGFEEGQWWRPVEFETLLDENGNFIALDLLREYDWNDLLAVVYTVSTPVTVNGQTVLEPVYQVGDVPGVDEDRRVDLDGDGTLYYKMKLLKPTNPGDNPHVWAYVLRNIYPLGGSNIDQSSFEFTLDVNTLADGANLVPGQLSGGVGIEWFQVFGLDREDQQGNPGSDGIADFHDQVYFDLTRGLLKFPLNIPEPFNMAPERYEALAPDAFDFAGSGLADYLMPKLYEPTNSQTELTQNTDKMRFTVTHAAASSSFNLGVSNIEEGSETVVLDGRTLVKDVDYDIDYTFGEISLKGEAAASLTADSNISVDYQYAPFIGGGNSSLLGLNVGYQLGRESRLSSTWLWESNQVVGHKAKLGEEPSRTLVGNLNGQFQFRPRLLTSFANLLSRRNTDRESSVQINTEMALSLPNPNTFNDAHVEDFEGVDSSDVMPISRLSWNDASKPVHDEGLELEADDPRYLALNYLLDTYYAPEDRVDARWYLPRVLTERRHLNPDLKEQEGRETQQVLQLHLQTPDGETWGPQHWGGIMRGLSRSGVDLTKTQFLEFWVNDFRHDVLGDHPTGTLHFDFGYISEDFYWRDRNGDPEYGVYNREDGIIDGSPDGIFTQSQDNNEDVGLGGDAQGYDRYSADYVSDANPYPFINGTAGNFREDSEDLDGDTRFDTNNGYFTISVDLADSALVDVLRDYPASEVQDNIDERRAWRKYRVRLGDLLPVAPAINGSTPSLATVTHMRIWFEDREPPQGATSRDLQFSEITFLGSRWEREGVRKLATADAPEEQILDFGERSPNEGFFLGEVNNKENPDYDPPFELYVLNNIPEKESSLVLDYQHLEPQHLVRASRVVSPRGDDYTKYSKLSYYVYSPDPDQADMDVFFRVGADSLNYYEVNYRFDESQGARFGWHELRLDMAELSNVKLEAPDHETGWIESTVNDDLTGQPYRVRVVGAPDLRRVKRFYVGVRNTDRTSEASGYFWFNDIKLREVQRDAGLAQRLHVGVNMANQINFEVDWNKQDAEFHGLNKQVGQGYTSEDWNVSGSLSVDDFIPLLGFRMPVSAGRSRTTQRPKYVTSSDIEIIDEALRDAQSSIDERKSFSVRLSRPQPSGFAPLRYVLDPWQFSLSGSRSTSDTPLQRSTGDNLQGNVSYDLRLGPGRSLNDYPLLRRIPVVKAVNPFPTNISLSGAFTNTRRESSNLQTATGTFVEQPLNETRRGTLNAKIDAKPLPIVDAGLTIRSDRDLFRERRFWGLNVGEENTYNQQLRLSFGVPRHLGLPDNLVGRAITGFVGELNSLKPNVQFTGAFVDDHSPSVRRENDPANVSNIRSSGDWSVTFSVPLGDKFSRVFPKKVDVRQDERQRILREIQNQVRRDQITDPELQELVAQLAEPGLNPRDKQRLEDRIVELARELERERREAVAGTAQADTTASLFAEEGGGFRIPNPLSPLMDLMRGVQPIQLNWTSKDEGAYTRYRGATTFWYEAGLTTDLEAPDSLYVSRDVTERITKKASTRLKFSRNMTMDVKFDESETHRVQAGGLATRTFNRSWPDLGFSLAGIEKWGIFGGGGADSPIRSSNLDLTYKRTSSVAGETATQSNPKETLQLGPRWSTTFRSGMTAQLNLVLTFDDNENNGSLTKTNRTAVNAQVRHSFGAEGILSKLGLYRPGNSPMVTMTVDVSVSDDSVQRWQPGVDREGEPNTVTGSSRISVVPSFSYNITRNLTGAMRMSYARDKVKESDTVTQRFGLGVEATFNF